MYARAVLILTHTRRHNRETGVTCDQVPEPERVCAGGGGDGIAVEETYFTSDRRVRKRSRNDSSALLAFQQDPFGFLQIDARLVTVLLQEVKEVAAVEQPQRLVFGKGVGIGTVV